MFRSNACICNFHDPFVHLKETYGGIGDLVRGRRTQKLDYLRGKDSEGQNGGVGGRRRARCLCRVTIQEGYACVIFYLDENRRDQDLIVRGVGGNVSSIA